MRKIIRNPVKVRIERPDYKKFKVADLGINIVENPTRKKRKPKEYTIMETAIYENPTYSRSRIATSKVKDNKIKVMVFSQVISGNPYTCFSDGKKEACLPAEWQMTSSLLSRMIVKSGRRAKDVQDEISTGSSVIEIPESDFILIAKDADKYGKLMQINRELTRVATEAPDIIQCETSTFRYLAASLSLVH